MKGPLKNGICINNVLQYASNTIFIAARSRIIQDIITACGSAEPPSNDYRILRNPRTNLILPVPTKTEGRIGTGGTAISVMISFSGLSPRFSNSQSCRILKYGIRHIAKVIKQRHVKMDCGTLLKEILF